MCRGGPPLPPGIMHPCRTHCHFGGRTLGSDFFGIDDSLTLWPSKWPSAREVLKFHACWLIFLILHFGRLRFLMEGIAAGPSVVREALRFHLGCFSFLVELLHEDRLFARFGAKSALQRVWGQIDTRKSDHGSTLFRAVVGVMLARQPSEASKRVTEAGP